MSHKDTKNTLKQFRRSLFMIMITSIKFHFDLMHKDGNLEKAVKLIDEKDRNDFSLFRLRGKLLNFL